MEIGIIIAIIVFVLWLVSKIWGFFSNLVGGSGRLVIILIVLIVSFLVLSWEGILADVVIALIVYLLRRAGIFIGRSVKEHDQKRLEAAKVKQITHRDKVAHDNEVALIDELNKNCRWLGYVTPEMWRSKLPNFVSRQYDTSFDSITSNFAQQLEQQNILQNNEWTKPYLDYLIKNPQGATVTKMLDEVICKPLYITHSTPDGDLLNTWLISKTKRKSEDVPPLFTQVPVKEMNEYLFVPTPYAIKTYGSNDGAESKTSNKVELRFEDL